MVIKGLYLQSVLAFLHFHRGLLQRLTTKDALLPKVGTIFLLQGDNDRLLIIERHLIAQVALVAGLRGNHGCSQYSIALCRTIEFINQFPSLRKADGLHRVSQHIYYRTRAGTAVVLASIAGDKRSS